MAQIFIHDFFSVYEIVRRMTPPPRFTIDEAAKVVHEIPQTIRRAVDLGAILLDADGLITEAELRGFIEHRFKQHRYDSEGNKRPGVKS